MNRARAARRIARVPRTYDTAVGGRSDRPACGRRGHPKIRRAGESDIDPLLRCLRSAFEPYRPRYTVAAFRDTVLTRRTARARLHRMNVLVAESETGEVVGTVAWVRESEALAHIRGMAVDPSRQGRGLARSLLAAALDEIRAAGVRRVTLDTTPPLRRAMRFYERNGFRRSGRVSDFFGMRLIEYDRTLGRRRK